MWTLQFHSQQQQMTVKNVYSCGQTRWIVCVSGVKVMLYCALWTWLASWLATMQIRAWNKKHPGALQKEALMSFIWRCITSLSVQSHVYLLYTDPKGRRKLASVSRFSKTTVRLNGAQIETSQLIFWEKRTAFSDEISSMSETAKFTRPNWVLEETSETKE